MARTTHRVFRRFLWALPLAAAILIVSVAPARSAGSASAAIASQPETLSSLQDQCVARAERSTDPDRMKAVCVGWALLALDTSAVRAAKAGALRDACVREVRYGSALQIRESTRYGEEMCRALHATVAK